MKKNKKTTLILLLLIGILASCDKVKDSSNNDNILGIWISTDKSDTLDFIDKTNVYKSNAFFRHDHYDYQLDIDSIEVGYKGILYVLVKPTTHKYNLDGNNLTIDFSNKSCYGFESNVMNYTRK